MKKITKKISSIILCFAMLVGVASVSAACGHTHVAGEPVRKDEVAATCTENGSYTEVVYCKDCGEEMSRETKTEEALGHSVTAPVKENVSIYPCLTGKITYDEVIYCGDCHAEISRVEKFIESDEHTPGEEVKENEAAATCYAEGGYDTVVYCEGCKEELTREHHVIDKTAHAFDGETYSKDKTGHWHACKNEGCPEKDGFEAHVPGAPATETTSQVCTKCGYVLASPVGHVHANHLTLVPAKEADCLSDGNTAYYSCSCGNWYEDEAATTLIDNHDDTVIRATGHSFDEDWTYDETHHWHAATCEHTNEKQGEDIHAFDEGVLGDGVKTFTCTVCGKTKTINVYTVTLEYNYEGAPAAVEIDVDEGGKFTTPNGFGREMHKVTGWYTDAACTQMFDLSAGITSDIRLYPKWEALTDEYIIEAEYIDLTGIKGVGYSNETQGTGLIQKDEDVISSDGTVQQAAAGASNGYYLGYLYKRGITLTFKINSDEATENATLKLSLGAEYWESITLSCTDLVVSVNGEAMTYETMVIPGNKGYGYPGAFNDFTVGVGVNLQKGENIITIRVNNSRPMEAAMKATAPLLDCLKIYSDTVVTYTPKISNLDKFNK